MGKMSPSLLVVSLMAVLLAVCSADVTYDASYDTFYIGNNSLNGSRLDLVSIQHYSLLIHISSLS